MQALWAAEVDIDRVWWECIAGNSLTLSVEFPTLDNLSSFLKGTKYILSRSKDGWHHCCASLIKYWAYPSVLGCLLLVSLLDKGLNPDLRVLTFDQPSQKPFHCPLLVYALGGLRSYRDKINVAKQADDSTGFDPQVSDTRPELNPRCVVESLLRWGADIHYIFESSFDCASSWYYLDSLGTMSVRSGIGTDWSDALATAGVDVDTYLRIDMLIRKQEFRLRGAFRSGFDERVLDLPSTAGLRCRPCRRVYCTEHGRDVFEDKM